METTKSNPSLSPRVIAAVQARLGSTRLPRKVLKKIGGKTIIEIITERLRGANYIDGIVLAVPSNEINDPLAHEGRHLGLKVFRGTEVDILSRLLGAAQLSDAEAVVRITADCPFVEPGIVDQLTRVFKKDPARYDYLGNILKRTYPDGLDVEIFTVSLLKKLKRCLKTPSERELISTYVKANWPLARIYNLRSKRNLSSIRLTLDYPEDLQLLSLIYTRLHRPGTIFRLKDILDFIEKNPNILKINEKWSY